MPTGVDLLGIAQKFGEGYVDLVGYMTRHNVPINFTRHMLVQTTVCKFIRIDDGEVITKLTDHREPLWKTRGYAHKIDNRCRPVVQR